MTALDWIIVALTLTTAVAGYFQGFVVGAATLAGFAAGLFVGARVGQAVVSAGSQSPYAPLFGLAGALIGGMLFGSVLERAGLRAAPAGHRPRRWGWWTGWPARC